MRNLKRLLSILLASVLIINLFACGAKTSTTASNTAMSLSPIAPTANQNPSTYSATPTSPFPAAKPSQ